MNRQSSHSFHNNFWTVGSANLVVHTSLDTPSVVKILRGGKFKIANNPTCLCLLDLFIRLPATDTQKFRWLHRSVTSLMIWWKVSQRSGGLGIGFMSFFNPGSIRCLYDWHASCLGLYQTKEHRLEKTSAQIEPDHFVDVWRVCFQQLENCTPSPDCLLIILPCWNHRTRSSRFCRKRTEKSGHWPFYWWVFDRVFR